MVNNNEIDDIKNRINKIEENIYFISTHTSKQHEFFSKWNSMLQDQIDWLRKGMLAVGIANIFWLGLEAVKYFLC